MLAGRAGGFFARVGGLLPLPATTHQDSHLPGLEELEKNDAAERSETTAAATIAEPSSDAQSPSEARPSRRPGGRSRKSSSTKKRGRPKGSSNKPKTDVAETPEELTPAPVVVPLEKCELAVAGMVKMITKLTSRGRIEWSDEELEEWGKYWGAPLQPFMSIAGRASPWIVAIVGSANLVINKLAEQGEAGKSAASDSLEAPKVEP